MTDPAHYTRYTYTRPSTTKYQGIDDYDADDDNSDGMPSSTYHPGLGYSIRGYSDDYNDNDNIDSYNDPYNDNDADIYDYDDDTLLPVANTNTNTNTTTATTTTTGPAMPTTTAGTNATTTTNPTPPAINTGAATASPMRIKTTSFEGGEGSTIYDPESGAYDQMFDYQVGQGGSRHHRERMTEDGVFQARDVWRRGDGSRRVHREYENPGTGTRTVRDYEG
ncbi:hypothetical protein BJX99DRAFT_239381 [Aspergillus californicus]